MAFSEASWAFEEQVEELNPSARPDAVVDQEGSGPVEVARQSRVVEARHPSGQGGIGRDGGQRALQPLDVARRPHTVPLCEIPEQPRAKANSATQEALRSGRPQQLMHARNT